jgi:hypothetical protein
MSLQQGPIIVVSDDRTPAFMAALGEGGLFPVIETTWAEASPDKSMVFSLIFRCS